jgi:hypothetical protein
MPYERKKLILGTKLVSLLCDIAQHLQLAITGWQMGIHNNESSRRLSNREIFARFIHGRVRH